jgi:hypothetical protein
MRITKKKVIAGALVGSALLATLPAVAEAKGGGGGKGGGSCGITCTTIIAGAAAHEAGDVGPAEVAPPGYFLWHVKLSEHLIAHKHWLEFVGWNSNGAQVVDIKVRRKHNENAYFNPFKVAKAELLYDGQPVSFTINVKQPDGQDQQQTVTQAPNNDDYCFAKVKSELREVVTGVGCNAR